MCCSEQFSDVTKQYLCCFYEILDNMIEEMTSAKLTNSISHNFIVQMIPHHQAIDYRVVHLNPLTLYHVNLD